MKLQTTALVLALAASLQARAEDPKPAPEAPIAAPAAAEPGPAEPAAKPVGRHLGVMAMKPVVCREVPNGKGKTGADLAAAIETMGARMVSGGYHLAGIVPGDPPIACFTNNTDPAKLPMGAR